MRNVRPLLAALLVVLAALLGACGGHEPADERTEAETEGVAVNAGGLLYQVQVSRQMNPLIPQDRAYFVDLPPGQDELGDGELWFGVWLRVTNVSEDEPAVQAASEFSIHDTQENVYRPVPVGPQNVFRYRAEVVQEDETLPRRNSAPAERSPNGALLLFKLQRLSFENRPLELVIETPGREPARAVINLDV